MRSTLSAAALLFVLPVLVISTPPLQRGQAPALQVPLSAAECKCSIEVTVKSESSGEPIRDVAITVGFIPLVTVTPQLVLTATTDSVGRATFSNLAEGTYSIAAQREGFFGPTTIGFATTRVSTSIAVGPATNNSSITTNALTAGSVVNAGTASAANLVKQPVQHVAFNMIQGGIISGRILDSKQRPAIGVSVSPYEFAYVYGQRILRQGGPQVQTDDLGQFRLFWVAPGGYYLRAESLYGQEARGTEMSFPSPTYHPGTLDLARATRFVVREGQELSGVNFQQQIGAGVTISGTVTNTLPGRVNPNGTVARTVSSFYLVSRNSSFAEPLKAILNTGTGARGTAGVDATSFPFEIREVPPGSYDFYPVFTDAAGKRYTGRLTIDVGTENITGINTAIQPGVEMNIHLSVIGTPPQTQSIRSASVATAPTIYVKAQAVDNLLATLISGLVEFVSPDADGRIAIANLPEARFFIPMILGLPTDSYVSEMRQGSRNIMGDTNFTVGREKPDPVEIIISRNGGTISGTIQDVQHKPLSGTKVFLIPDVPRRRNLLLYKTTTSNTMGAFNFQGIAPGAYKLFAWDSIPQGAEQNDEFLSRYDGLGTRVVVSAGTPMANVQVTLIQGNR